jgi:PAT family beta-lactamase induction signal transducer AmpG
MAGIMVLLTTTVFWISEPQTERQAFQAQASANYTDKLTLNSQRWSHRMVAWLAVSLIEPFREFFQRNGVRLALSILLFIFLFKIGEAFLGRMSIVFYKEIGFSNTQIGTYSKLLNWWVTIIFAVIGGMVNMRYGIYRGLMVGGIAMAASNIMFAFMAMVGPNTALFAATVFVDGFTAAWSSVALVAFISLLCNQAFSASQYALMASLGVFGRTLLASSSGYIVDSLDGNWALFFILTALMVIPSLLFLRMIREPIMRMEERM